MDNVNKSIEITGTVRWDNLADEFYNFLLAMGYNLTKTDLADHYNEYSESVDYSSEMDDDTTYD